MRGEYENGTYKGQKRQSSNSNTKSAWTSYFKDAIAHEITKFPNGSPSSALTTLGESATPEQSAALLSRLGVKVKQETTATQPVGSNQSHQKNSADLSSAISTLTKCQSA